MIFYSLMNKQRQTLTAKVTHVKLSLTVYHRKKKLKIEHDKTMQLHYERNCKHEYLVSCKTRSGWWSWTAVTHVATGFRTKLAIIVQSRSRSRLTALFGLSDDAFALFDLFFSRRNVKLYQKLVFLFANCISYSGPFCKGTDVM